MSATPLGRVRALPLLALLLAPLGLGGCASAPPARQDSLWVNVGDKKLFITAVREATVLSVTVGIPQSVDEPWRDPQRLARAEEVSLQASIDGYQLPLADQPRPGVLPFSQTPTGGYGLAHFAFDLPADVRAAMVRCRVRLRGQEQEFTLTL